MPGTSVVFHFADPQEKRSSSRDRIKSKSTQASLNQTFDLGHRGEEESIFFNHNASVLGTGENLGPDKLEVLAPKKPQLPQQEKPKTSKKRKFWSSLFNRLP